MGGQPFSPDEVRDDFIPREAYYSRDFAAAEAEHLWPRTWQMACRLEEIPNVGDYLVYEILTDSIVVLRTGEGADDLRAFHNVCPHRGNQLVTGRGNARQFVCSFHGWRFALDGRCVAMIDGDDWKGCFAREDAHLVPVCIGHWGGWVFVTMDDGAQPLADFLEPMRSRCDKFEFEKMRYAWYKTTIVKANWKTVQEAFLEFYHVQTTHPQMLVYTKDYSVSEGMGRHGTVSYSSATGMPIGRSDRLPPREETDFRNYVFEYAEQFKNDLAAMQTDRAYAAAQRLRTELTADASPVEVMTRWGSLIYEAAIAEGAGWPEGVTPEYLNAAGFHWHVFPNMVFLPPAVEAILGYRFRPYGDDPEMCLFDIWALERYAPGKEPPFKPEFYEDWSDGGWPLIYSQDFANIPKVQKGMRSRAFKGGRTSPVQERAISNFHRALRRFMQDPHADDAVGPALT